MYQYLGNTGIALYNFFGFVGTLIAFVWNFCHIKAKRQMLSGVSVGIIDWASNKKRLRFLSNSTIWAILETIIFSSVQMLFIGTINVWFGPLVGTGANYFGTLFFVPIILILICFLIGMDPRKQLDLLTPTFPLLLIFVKMACFCEGCCRGFAWEYGMYNHATNMNEFPVQLVEMGNAAIIFVFLLAFKKKTKEGCLFPVYVSVYSATRFFSEFLRCEPKVFLYFNTYQILCVSGIVYGIILIVLNYVFSAKLNHHFEKYSRTRTV